MRAMVRSFIVFSVFLLTAAGVSIGGDCPEIEKLRSHYRGKPFISANFVQLTISDVFDEVDTLKGSVWAGWEGRFRLSMPNQVLASNGILYWSYSAENEQVIIDSVSRLGQWNPLTLLYDPQQVYRCQGQKTVDNMLEFDMAAVDSSISPARFTLRVHKDDYQPKALIYKDDNDSRIEVKITEFSRRQSLPDSLFEFHPGPGVEVITMP